MDWSGALVSAWTASEGLLGDLLKRYVDQNETRETGFDAEGNKHDFIEQKRREWLLASSQMTARHKMEVLSLVGWLPFELYMATERCGKARNKWIHAEKEPAADDAYLAVGSLGRLFELVEEVPLHVVWQASDATA